MNDYFYDDNEATEANEPVIPKDSLVFIPLGGIGEIGMNFYLYHYLGKWLVVDLGIGFPGDIMPGVEVMLPDPSFIERHKKDIVGMVFTHAHEDHIGGISYLWRYLNCPIYLSAFAAEVLKPKLQDVGLVSRVDLHLVKAGDKLCLSPFNIKFIGQTHSIPEAMGLAITTDKGTVFHSGDWKFEDNALLGEKYDLPALEQIGKDGVLALICDSTNVFREEQDRSERDVRENLIVLFSHYAGHIVVTCFSSNIARIESIAIAANKNGRKVCLLGRSLERITEAARKTGYLQDVEEFISEDEAQELNPADVLYISTGSQGEKRSALSNLLSKGKHYPALKAGDIVVFSSRVIPGNEYQISKLQNRILACGASIITEKDAHIHASGHPSKKELSRLYDILKPRISIPMHGDLSHLLEQKKISDFKEVPFCFVIKNGDVVNLDYDNPSVLGVVESGTLVADGNRLLSPDEDIFKKRKKVLMSGSAVVTVVIDKNYKVVGDVLVSSFDLFDKVMDAFDIEKLATQIKLAVEDVEEIRKDNDEAIKEIIKVTLRQYTTKEFGKKPLVDVHLVRV